MSSSFWLSGIACSDVERGIWELSPRGSGSCPHLHRDGLVWHTAFCIGLPNPCETSWETLIQWDGSYAPTGFYIFWVRLILYRWCYVERKVGAQVMGLSNKCLSCGGGRDVFLWFRECAYRREWRRLEFQQWDTGLQETLNHLLSLDWLSIQEDQFVAWNPFTVLI